MAGIGGHLAANYLSFIHFNGFSTNVIFYVCEKETWLEYRQKLFTFYHFLLCFDFGISLYGFWDDWELLIVLFK